MQLLPTHATPPEELPRVIVRRFTFVLALLWFGAACVHVYQGVQQFRMQPPVLETRSLTISWPKPASLFDVISLHCNSSLVVVDSGFSLYAAQRLTQESAVGKFVHVGDTGADAVFCGRDGCDMLLSKGGWGALKLAPLKPPWGSNRSISIVQVSESWLLTTAVIELCMPSPCEVASLAGWDGSKVVIATAQRKGPHDAWEVQSRFAVHPGRGGCLGGAHCLSGASTHGNNYSSVRSLQLSASGRTLTVLHSGNLLDGWDLTSGAQLGRWRLQGNPLAMCHDGHQLVVAIEGIKRGPPSLEVAMLPTGLAEAGCFEHGRESHSLPAPLPALQI